MLYRRHRSPLFVLGLVGCTLIGIATAFYVASTQYWSGQKVADVDALGAPAAVALDPAMNPVRVILHRSGPRLRRTDRTSVDVTLRDAAGAELWTEHQSWSGRTSKSKSHSSGRKKSSSVLATFDVPAAGEYRFETTVQAPEGYAPRELRLEVRRQVARVNPTIVWTGVIGAVVVLLAGIVGAKATGG